MTYSFLELLVFFWLTLHHTKEKEILYVNTNFMGNQSWNKNKHFHLFLILMLKKSVFLNVKLKHLMNTFKFFLVSWTHFLKQPSIGCFSIFLKVTYNNHFATLLWRANNFFFSTCVRHIVWCIKSRNRLFINLSSIVRFSKSTFTWDPKWTLTGLRFHFGVKFHFGVR